MSDVGRGSSPPARALRRAGLGLGVMAVAMLVWAALVVSGLGATPSVLCASALAGVTAALAARPVTPRPDTVVVAADRVLDAETLRSLRHDLRGILAPALMTADRLLMSTQDPMAKRAAEAMVETIERAEKRLAG